MNDQVQSFLTNDLTPKSAKLLEEGLKYYNMRKGHPKNWIRTAEKVNIIII